MQETQLKCSIAASKEFVPPSFGDPAELGSTSELLALPEESLPCVCVFLAHLLQLCLDLQMAPLGDMGLWVLLAWSGDQELPTHRDMQQALLRRAQWDWVPLESKQGCAGNRYPGVNLQMWFLVWLSEALC